MWWGHCMTWTDREKELVAVGTSVAAGCRPCTDYHFNKALETGATEDEIWQAMSIGIRVRNSATNIMQAFAYSHLDSEANIPAAQDAIEHSRIGLLISIGAAFAVNSTIDLEKHLTAAKAMHITDTEIKAVAKLALMIKGVGSSHVEKMIGIEKED